MIICQCAVIREAEVETAIRSLREKNPKAQITQSRLFKELGKKPDCTDCAPLLNHRITRITADLQLKDYLKGDDIPRRLKR